MNVTIEIPDGYFRRQDQSMAFPLPGKGLLTCPYCKRKVTRLYGYEHKSLPDIEMCSTCMELYEGRGTIEPRTPPISADIACENCGHEFKVVLMDPDDLSEGMFSSISCIKCLHDNVFHFDPESKQVVPGFPVQSNQ